MIDYYGMKLPALQRSDGDVLVTYSVGSEESIPIAITGAFRAIGASPSDRETVVEDWIDGDAIERLCRASDRHLRVSTVIWDHPVIITPEEIQILTNQTTRSEPRRVF